MLLLGIICCGCNVIAIDLLLILRATYFRLNKIKRKGFIMHAILEVLHSFFRVELACSIHIFKNTIPTFQRIM
jgi:hypothetical protein